MNSKDIIQSVVCIVAIDGKIEPQEHQFLRELCQRLSISNDLLAEALEDAKQGKRKIHIPKSVDEKVELMALLVQAASSDGELAKQEHTALQRIAAKMDFSPNDLQKLVNKHFLSSPPKSDPSKTSPSKIAPNEQSSTVKNAKKQPSSPFQKKQSPSSSKVTFSKPIKKKYRIFVKIRRTLIGIAVLFSLLIVCLGIGIFMYPQTVEDIAWLWVSHREQPQEYTMFLKWFPNGQHAVEAEERYDKQMWSITLKANTIQDYENY